MIKSIFLLTDNHKHLHLFDDLVSIRNVELKYVEKKYIKSSILKKIREIHLSHTINKLIPLPLRRLWYTNTKIENIEENFKYDIFVLDTTLSKIDYKDINKMRQNNNIRLILILINSLEGKSSGMIEMKDIINKVKWDDIRTFDPVDAKMNKYTYLGMTYYSKKQLSEDVSIKSDAYFVGGLKGDREDNIFNVYKELRDKNVNINFDIMITGLKKLRKKKFENEINYYSNKWLPYEKILENINTTNCIIEILQEGQSGPSLRYYEAVCYNKKLLTNNNYIKEFPFYNEKYMKIFNNENDIDIEWIKRREKVDYQYNGDFSPKKLIGDYIEME
jgi:hypothetical protein